MNGPVVIVDAAEDDLTAILALNQANVPHVGDIDAAKLARLHRVAWAVRVARVARVDDGGDFLGVGMAGAGARNAIRGFLLAMDETADYESLNFRWFVERYPRFTYVDRIAVAEGFRGLGIGRALYADVEALARRRRRGDGDGDGVDNAGGRQLAVEWITCEVNLAPPNPGSMAFHERLGFVGVGERWDEGGGTGVRMMAKGLR